jgi:hypothetical protein
LKNKEIILDSDTKQFIREITTSAMLEDGCSKKEADKVNKILESILEEFNTCSPLNDNTK